MRKPIDIYHPLGWLSRAFCGWQAASFEGEGERKQS